MPSNADQEMKWIDLWESLLAITHEAADYPCVLPDGKAVDVETCKGWLQSATYKGQTLRVVRGWHRGRPAAVVRLD